MTFGLSIGKIDLLLTCHFGKVLAAFKKDKFSKSLFKSLSNNLSGTHSIQWGISNESSAIDVLKQEENVEVTPTGLWLSNSGLLGALPDGLVGSNYTVEVKCPWKYRNKNLIAEIDVDHTYIVYKINGNLIVNKKHPYWDQIQGQLYLTNREFCYLFIWTPEQVLIAVVEKDTKWAINLEILEQFFIQKYIPYHTEG
ncbi:uncharacterized protein LOC103309687 [Acyrthosiphon pisum]|uniref:YqaJ viral recombinase domain-containing protein n=1 Tax=Acyrthosiphon pisum TaxID=7029 RepID=A0A8R2B6N3_ACYPI|nr:uncharacterized protein LOC103309687 [Acyrthosiphon pisum]|eukprot:XP_008184002.1 PREDICTED: uncharacterized protein LOC103309687 [Acyrthosiphon pisum]